MGLRKILIVDDNKDFADVFCDILRANNYDAHSCYGGVQAIEQTKDSEFDVMFLDIMMPDMDGVETLKEIKKIQPDATVIMMTGYSVDEMVHKAIEQKATDVIYKPFDIDKVLNMLQNTA